MEAPMRRMDRAITDAGEMLDIIGRCKVCRLGLSDGGMPYVVPLNFGYSFAGGRLALYFHGAAEGRRLDIARANKNACFEVDCDGSLVEGERACDFGYVYQSVIGFGEIAELGGRDEKSAALNCIMRHQTGMDAAYDFTDGELAGVAVCRLDVAEFTGKRKPPPAHRHAGER
jgi:nitroimidazol reductase NimA-like FMN-containing flavoprotein (pyridoxamine 5'-phosphate oxidase superfamily)